MQLLAGCQLDAARKWMLLEDANNLDKYVEILLSEGSTVASIAAFGAAAHDTSSSSANVGTVNSRRLGKGQQQSKG